MGYSGFKSRTRKSSGHSVIDADMKGGTTTADPRIRDDEARDETHIIGLIGLQNDDHRILLTTKIEQHVKMIQVDDSCFLKIFPNNETGKEFGDESGDESGD